MNKDSVALAPELFSLLGIAKIEDEAMEKTGLELGESNNRRCAYVTGAYGVDQVIFNSIEATRVGRTGGMATSRGDTADPHIINVTGGGAGLTAASSGVRLSIYPGSTEMLNQSSNGVTDLVMYQVRACCCFNRIVTSTVRFYVVHPAHTITLCHVRYDFE